MNYFKLNSNEYIHFDYFRSCIICYIFVFHPLCTFCHILSYKRSDEYHIDNNDVLDANSNFEYDDFVVIAKMLNSMKRTTSDDDDDDDDQTKYKKPNKIYMTFQYFYEKCHKKNSCLMQKRTSKASHLPNSHPWSFLCDSSGFLCRMSNFIGFIDMDVHIFYYTLFYALPLPHSLSIASFIHCLFSNFNILSYANTCTHTLILTNCTHSCSRVFIQMSFLYMHNNNECRQEGRKGIHNKMLPMYLYSFFIPYVFAVCCYCSSLPY